MIATESAKRHERPTEPDWRWCVQRACDGLTGPKTQFMTGLLDGVLNGVEEQYGTGTRQEIEEILPQAVRLATSFTSIVAEEAGRVNTLRDREKTVAGVIDFLGKSGLEEDALAQAGLSREAIGSFVDHFLANPPTLRKFSAETAGATGKKTAEALDRGSRPGKGFNLKALGFGPSVVPVTPEGVTFPAPPEKGKVAEVALLNRLFPSSDLGRLLLVTAGLGVSGWISLYTSAEAFVGGPGNDIPPVAYGIAATVNILQAVFWEALVSTGKEGGSSRKPSRSEAILMGVFTAIVAGCYIYEPATTGIGLARATPYLILQIFGSVIITASFEVCYWQFFASAKKFLQGLRGGGDYEG